MQRRERRGRTHGLACPPVPWDLGVGLRSESLSASPWLSSERASRRGAGKGAAGGGAVSPASHPSAPTLWFPGLPLVVPCSDNSLLG